MLKRMRKVFYVNIVVERNLFQASVFKINHTFAMKKNKISHFKSFNHASHFK